MSDSALITGTSWERDSLDVIVPTTNSSYASSLIRR